MTLDCCKPEAIEAMKALFAFGDQMNSGAVGIDELAYVIRTSVEEPALEALDMFLRQALAGLEMAKRKFDYSQVVYLS